MNIEEISNKLQGCVGSLGFEYVGIENVKEEGVQTLRLYVDKEGGISLDDCELVAKEVGALLDADEAEFDDRYLLEVSSPGLERPLFKLADYEKFVGSPVAIRLKTDFEGRRRLSAVIEGVADGKILLDCEGEGLDVPFDIVAQAHLIYIEKKGQKKTFKKKGVHK